MNFHLPNSASINPTLAYKHKNYPLKVTCILAEQLSLWKELLTLSQGIIPFITHWGSYSILIG